MCAPVATLALIGSAVSAAGTGFAALQANAQSNYQARVADQNAKLAAEAARTQQDATRQELQSHWRRQAQLQGQQRVAMAAGGLDLGFGNAADLQADDAEASVRSKIVGAFKQVYGREPTDGELAEQFRRGKGRYW